MNYRDEIIIIIIFAPTGVTSCPPPPDLPLAIESADVQKGKEFLNLSELLRGQFGTNR